VIQGSSGLLSLLSGALQPQNTQAEGTTLASMVGKPGAFAAFYGPQRNKAISSGLQGMLSGASQEQPAKHPILVAQEEQALAASQQQARLRETMAANARRLNLDAVSDSLLSGGDIEEATETINEAESKRALDIGGRRAKQVIAAKAGMGTEFNTRIGAGDFDSFSPTEFLNLIEGESAELKPYIGRDGKAAIFRISEEGKVLDETTDTWVNPGELGLRPAPVTTQTLSDADVFTRKVWEQKAVQFMEANQAAIEGVESLRLNNEAVGIINNEIFSGALGEAKLTIAKALVATGLIEEGGSTQETIANSEAYTRRRAIAVGAIIKLFGSGTGLSDADREYAEGIAAGTITLDEQAMRRILAMERMGNRNIIKNNNKTVDDLLTAGRFSQTEADLFRVAAPVGNNIIVQIAQDSSGRNVFNVGTRTAPIWQYGDGAAYAPGGTQ
jgi:hypothetical protein